MDLKKKFVPRRSCFNLILVTDVVPRMPGYWSHFCLGTRINRLNRISMYSIVNIQ